MAKSKTSKRYTREFRQELVALHRAGRSILCRLLRVSKSGIPVMLPPSEDFG
jgi:transposase-like protein